MNPFESIGSAIDSSLVVSTLKTYWFYILVVLFFTIQVVLFIVAGVIRICGNRKLSKNIIYYQIGWLWRIIRSFLVSMKMIPEGDSGSDKKEVPGPIIPPTPTSHDPFPKVVKLFGRDEDIKHLTNLLDRSQPQVVQMIGQSGVGKTALAAKVIHDLERNYVRLELRPEDNAEGVAVRLYRVLTQQEDPKRPHAEVVAGIVDAWKKQNCLMVLDNLHNLLNTDAMPKDEPAEVLLERLGGCGGKLLTLGWPGTNALGINTEQVYRWELPGIGEEPGVQKLRAEGVTGEPTSISLKEVVETLNGNPRMLEILSKLIVKYGGDAAILDSREKWIEDSDAPLEAMWEAIGEELRQVLSVLCILRRGRNAAFLAVFLNHEANVVQKQIESLMEWGLVKSVQGTMDYAPDHDLVRRMACGTLSEDKLFELHGRAVDIWMNVGKDIGKEKTPTTLAEIQPLLEAGYHMAQRKDGDAVYKLLNTEFGGVWLEDLADWFGAWSDRLDLWRCAAENTVDKTIKKRAIHNLGIVYQQRGDWDTALNEYEESLKIEEEIGDQRGIAASRHQIGRINELRGKWDAALKEYKESLRIKEEIGDQLGIAITRHHVGTVYQEKGEWDAALKEYEESLKIEEEIGDQRKIAATRHQIGNIHYLMEDLGEALKEYNESLKIKEKIGDRPGIAKSRNQIGSVYHERKEYGLALVEYLTSLNIFTDLGSPDSQTAILNIIHLRRDWGAENFDKAWKEKTEEEVPEGIIKASEELKKGELKNE